MLSGGNQQKIVIARWLFAEAELFILDEPTQGIDIGAKHRRLPADQRADRARARRVILISSDHDELLAMSDRVGIMSHGRIVAIRAAERPRQDRSRPGFRRSARSRRRHEAHPREPIAGAARGAMILWRRWSRLTTDRFLDPGNLDQPGAAGLDRRDRGDRLDHRHLHRRHRSVARLGDRADDHGLRHAGRRSAALPLPLAIVARARCSASCSAWSTACSPPICASRPSSPRWQRSRPFAASPSCSTTARRSSQVSP